jgi:Sortase domain
MSSPFKRGGAAVRHPSPVPQTRLLLLLLNLVLVVALALVLVNPAARSSAGIDRGTWLAEPRAGDAAASNPVPTATPAAGGVATSVGERVTIPALGVDLPIVEGAGGSEEPPLNAAAHYPNTGDPGMLYAHARPGMFGALLTNGAVGQRVLVGSKSYRIISLTRNWPVTRPIPIPAGTLVLYTCTSWIYSDPKVVAYAEPQ